MRQRRAIGFGAADNSLADQKVKLTSTNTCSLRLRTCFTLGHILIALPVALGMDE